MDNKETNMNELQAAAIVYADALVEYHTAQQSDVCDKARWVRETRDALYIAQNYLDQLALAKGQQGN